MKDKPYDADRNGYDGWRLAIASLREINIRRGSILPEPGNAVEERWRAEGTKPPSQLDSVRSAFPFATDGGQG